MADSLLAYCLQGLSTTSLRALTRCAAGPIHADLRACRIRRPPHLPGCSWGVDVTSVPAAFPPPTQPPGSPRFFAAANPARLHQHRCPPLHFWVGLLLGPISLGSGTYPHPPNAPLAPQIFLFDHNSSVPMIAEVSDYVAAGKVQYTYLTSTLPRIAGPEDFPNGFQGRVFGECLEQARGYYKW